MSLKRPSVIQYIIVGFQQKRIFKTFKWSKLWKSSVITRNPFLVHVDPISEFNH